MASEDKYPPRIAKWFIEQSVTKSERDFLLGDFEEFYQEIRETRGTYRANIWYWLEAFKTIPLLISNYFYWRLVMLQNHIIIAYRFLIRNLGYSLINIFGLTSGIAFCIFILLFCLFELSYDAYHRDVDRTYLVALSRKSETSLELVSSNFPLLAPTLKEKYPQVENAGRINTTGIVHVSYKKRLFKEEELWYSDSEIFQLLDIPFIKGSPNMALTRTNTAVLSETMVKKYFGTEDPIGKVIRVGERDYEVTGIVRDSPYNTVFRYDIIMSWKTIENDEFMVGWHPGLIATLCLIKLREETDPKRFEELISRLPDEFVAEALAEMGLTYRNFLRPIDSIHLYSSENGTLNASASLIYVYIFSAAAILVLLIACMNFMNLSTARFANRAGEIGIRKVIGAYRKQIIWQFLVESFFMVTLALVFAIALVIAFMPYFNQLAETYFTVPDLFQPGIILGLIAILFFVSLVAGSYPAFFLSAFKPISIIRGTLSTGIRGTGIRRFLVVLQFTISISIVICTIIVHRQLNYMKTRSLGFDMEEKIVVTLRDWDMITDNYDLIKSEFLKNSNVICACASSGVPGSFINRTWTYPQNEESEKGQGFRSLRCDQDFIETYGIEVVAGRSFRKDISSDVLNAIILNEAGVKAFGWASPEEAVGKLLNDRGIPVVGVVKNFHWWGLQHAIEPMVIRVVPRLLRSITLTINPSNRQETISYIEETFKTLFPGDLFEYYHVDTNFQNQYRFEDKVYGIFRIFTVLGLIIACLGLVGLASFVTERRTKEIGIRKVFGASVPKIVTMLSKEFVLLVLVSNIVAWPLVYFVGQKWLQNFAYRVTLGVDSFILASFITLVIAVVTVSFQAIKASTRNPVTALNYE